MIRVKVLTFLSSVLRRIVNAGDDRKRHRTTRVHPIDPQKFRITHPFHPLLGREFESLGRKEYGGEYSVSVRAGPDLLDLSGIWPAP
ncbi:MAG: hypothetical protein JO108_17050 [Acidobacteriaceae bacterium]|nr:hypothetical protein [Acidobacteriaceae bacterium]